MQISLADEISLKNFLNAYFRENPNINYNNVNASEYIYYKLATLDNYIRIKLKYYSLIGRHQYELPAELMLEHPLPLSPWTLVSILVQDLTHRHPCVSNNQRNFMQRFFNSCENLEVILKNLSSSQIDDIFKLKVSFKMTENGLLMGHQLHPMAKSREGFDKGDFKLYSPELQNTFQLHYFLADPDIVFSESCLELNTDHLVRRHLLDEAMIDPNKCVLPIHPWQAKYLLQLPIIKKWINKGKLINLGCMGKPFTATTSVRTVYSDTCEYMVKCSLNVTITNSMRMQYGKELIRGIAAHRFWQSAIGKDIKKKYISFVPITDPAFICLRDYENIIHETTILLRQNYFAADNNVTSIATLCQDHPYEKSNRFTILLKSIATKKNLSLQESAILWFQSFLKNTIEPLLWLFTQYGIAVEGHQQNILVEIEDGLPGKGYYRDNQGYYVVDIAIPILKSDINESILSPFCQGSIEFIRHHLIYYLICNTVFGVINAIGTTGYITERNLLKELQLYLLNLKNMWIEKYPLLTELLDNEKLPFKGNLLTRFYELDELTAPLEQQSIYIEIDNIIRQE